MLFVQPWLTIISTTSYSVFAKTIVVDVLSLIVFVVDALNI